MLPSRAVTKLLPAANPNQVLDDAGGMWESRVLWSSHPNHFSKLLSLNRADLAKVAGRFVPVSAVLQFQISRCTMDRLGSLKSLDLQGCEMQVSELRVTDLAPPTGGFTSVRSWHPPAHRFLRRLDAPETQRVLCGRSSHQTSGPRMRTSPSPGPTSSSHRIGHRLSSRLQTRPGTRKPS